MFDISKNGIITISRGDSFSLDVFVNIGTVLEPIQYFLEENDRVFFALMEPNQPFEHALLGRVFTNEDCNEEGLVHMAFTSEMTQYLMPGAYYYMIKLVRNYDSEDELVDTITTKTKFFVTD